MAHTNNWDATFESKPADADEAKEGAEKIRDFKLDIRERMALEHYLVVGSNNNRHGIHTFKPTTITADPGPSSDQVIWYLCNPSGGAFDFTFIEASSSGLDGKIYILENIDTTNAVTIKCQTSDLINGTTDGTFTLSPGASVIALLKESTSDWRIYVLKDYLLTGGTLGLFLRAKGAATTPVWTAAPSPGFRNVKANFDNLVVKQVSSTTVDIDADSAVLYNTSGVSVKVGAINLTITLDNTGANGRDNAEGAVAVDWYHCWVIMKEDGTLAGYATKAATFPSSLPTDYLYVAFAGACRVSSTGPTVIVAFHQVGNRTRCVNGNVTVSGTSATSTDISAYVPDTAKLVHFVGSQNDGMGRLYIHPLTFVDTVTSGNVWYEFYADSNSSAQKGNCPIETAQTIFVGRAANNFTVYFHGWEF